MGKYRILNLPKVCEQIEFFLPEIGNFLELSKVWIFLYRRWMKQVLWKCCVRLAFPFYRFTVYFLENEKDENTVNVDN